MIGLLHLARFENLKKIKILRKLKHIKITIMASQYCSRCNWGHFPPITGTSHKSLAGYYVTAFEF